MDDIWVAPEKKEADYIYSEVSTDPYLTTFLQPRTRFLYKTGPEGCEVYLDVHVPKTPAPEKGYPVLFTIHGGGWTGGESKDVSPSQTNYCNDQGVLVITVDYRLTPQVTFLDVMEDVVDAWKFSHYQLPTLVDYKIDVGSVCVMGHSAGSVNTLSLGLMCQRDPTLPQPKCLVSFYGFNHWRDLPDGLVERRFDALKEMCTEEEWVPMKAFLDGPVISGFPDKDAFDRNRPQNSRRDWLFKTLAASANGVFNAFIFPASNDVLQHWSVLPNATSSYPPTWFVIPTEDAGVPPQQARDLSSRLKELGVETHISEAVGAGHAFDMHTVSGRFGGEWWKVAVQPALDWAIGKLKA